MTTKVSTPAPQAGSEKVGNISNIPDLETSFAFDELKGKIRYHYEVCSDYYYRLWGEHIHHGYFLNSSDTKGVAQIHQMELLLQQSKIPYSSTVLDVGFGLGGTARYLAKNHGCNVLGITLSSKQVELARKISLEQEGAVESDEGSIKFHKGSVRFLDLDAEAMNSAKLLNPGGKLVVSDWLKADGLTTKEIDNDIKPIENAMLLPPLLTQLECVGVAQEAGFGVFAAPFDTSDKVKKTWDISLALIRSPSLWASAISQGRDGLAFLQAFRAMRRGYANETFRYPVMAFEK